MRCFGTALALALLTAGCATARVGRDSQLDRLIGTWDGRATTTVRETGEVVEVRATTVTEWARHGEVMLERTVTEVGVETFTALAVWVWDPAVQACRTYRLLSDGTRETGLARHVNRGDVWQLQARSEDQATGSVTSGSGSMRFRAANEKDFDWVSVVDGVETLRVEGSSRRRD